MASQSQLFGPPPLDSPNSDTEITSGKPTGYFPIPWSDWFNSLFRRIQAVFFVVGSAQTATTGSHASIGVTPITQGNLAAGVYRITYYIVETQADNVGSSVMVTFGWTDKGTSRNLSGPALTANSITAAQSGSVSVRIDGSTPITYATTYSTTGGAPPMIYDLFVFAEQVPQVSA